MLLDLSQQSLMFLLFSTGLVAGAVDAIAGGGGLICLPMLLGVGVPPSLALGTNKLQASVGTCVAAFHYYRRGLVSLHELYKGLLAGFVGTVSGAYLSQTISNEVLKYIIPFLLLAVLIYTLASPKIGMDDRHPRMSEFYFYIIFGFVMGFYDGFFGPGTGSLWIFLLTFFLGFRLIKATAYTKFFNLKSNVIALVCFMIGGNIDYRFALYMAAGQVIGGKLGAHLAVKKGAQVIRPVFITIVSVTIATLVYRSFV